MSEKAQPWRCPHCGSHRWVAASLTRGLTVIPQCVPCGHYDGQHRVRNGEVVALNGGQSDG